jgi:nicotinamide-nucleotide amidase
MPDDGRLDTCRVSIEELAGRLSRRSEWIAIAESLTGGMLTSTLAASPGATDWLRGGVVAYNSDVKHSVLGVKRGPVVTRNAAESMARGVAELLKAELAVAITGVGGPLPREGKAPGTVWIAVRYHADVRVRRFRLTGDPTEICVATCRCALEMALDVTRFVPSALPHD